jgi:5-methylthioadenosine/S-adenosylhomocysteine deaminase
VNAADYVIDGTIITMDPERKVIRDGALAIKGGRIVAVGPASSIHDSYEANRTLGGKHRFVTPGFIDCHNHLSQSLVRDYAMEDLPNIHRIYIPAERAMDADDARVSSLVAVAQLLRSGVTTVAETTTTPEHEEVIARTIMETGIRCAMARGRGDRVSRFVPTYHQVTERSSFENDPGLLRDDLQASETFLAKWTKEGEGRLQPWLHNQGIVSSSDERYLAAKALAEEYATGLMTHINRDREDIELSMSLFGERPIEHLYRIGALGPNVLAIHAMLTTDREIRLLAESGGKVAHAPVICADLISALTRVVTMREWGVTVGLACDTVINDLLKVMRIAIMMHAATSGVSLYDPIALTSEEAFSMATLEGATALLWENEIGSLEPGKAADVVVIDGNNLRLTPAYNPVATLVRYATGSDVESVLVAGRLVVDGKRCTTIDEEALVGEAVRLGDKLGEALLPRRYRPLSMYAASHRPGTEP